MANLIGTAPDQVPVNGMLGTAAFLDSDVGFTGAINTLQVAPTIASAATIAPTNTVTFVSAGAVTAITTITPPTNLLTGGGMLILIPTGVFTTTVTASPGNIALATTAVVGKALIMTYDSATAKFYPSY